VPDSEQKDLVNIRINQISELKKWAEKNTDYENISAYEAVKFFDSDKEDFSKDLESISKIYSDIVNYAKTKFKIGEYTAMEYSNVILLKKTKGEDIEKIRKQIESENSSLIKPSLTSSAKISKIQNTVLKLTEGLTEKEISQPKLIEKLIEFGEFNEKEAEEYINKSIKNGALVLTDSDNISL